jgi:flagellar biosynthesis protein FlhF
MLARTSIVEQQPATVYQLDSHIANSAGQTAIFAEIIGAQFERTLPQNFERREESVFVDLPGVALGDEKGLATLRSIIESFGIPEIHLVLNAAYESAHLLDQARFFANIGITDLVVTHLDEEDRWGKIWNLVLGTNYSVRYLSCGQNVPGDLVTATPEVILNRQFRGK